MRTDGGDVRARAVVIATGVAYRKLGVPAVEDFVGLGVFYGSAMSAAREMEGTDVVVVGGGNSAGQAAIHLARFARSVTILVRRDGLEATMSQYLASEIGHSPRLRVRPWSEVVDAAGDGTWAVAIRCAELSADRRTARLVAGGGIVAESDPLSGLAETQAKRQAMLSAIVRP